MTQEEKELNSYNIESEIRMSECQHLLLMLDSLQEDPKCILTKDSYTDEDRKVLCENCDEKCEYSKKEEPVSEPNKELAETYLAVFDKKFPILPSLKGKQLADYKNFLNECQQIFGLKEWGIRPIQSKLFEKLSLLWAAWGAEHLQGVCRQDEKEQDIPVSDGLEEACEQLAENARKRKAETSSPFFSQTDYKQGVIDGAEWQKQQTISKACKWIDKNAAKYLVDRFVGSTRVVGIDTSITEDFRKDVENE